MEELVWKDFGCAQVRASSAGVSRGRPGSSRMGYMVVFMRRGANYWFSRRRRSEQSLVADCELVRCRSVLKLQCYTS